MNNPTPLCDSHKPMTSKVLLTRTQLQMRSGSDSQITEPAGLFLSERPRYAEWHIAAYKHVSYTVHLCSDLLDPNNPTLASAGSSGEASGRRRLIVLDAQVHKLHGSRISRYFAAQGVECELHRLDAHEGVKTMESVFGVVSAMSRFGISRRSEPLIAIGGGVLGDIAALAANLYRRSTPFVRVPTTLMGMIDAGIGVKTGVNFFDQKNRLGTYYPAMANLIDPAFLSTSDPRHLRNGMAEALKIGLIKDVALYRLLQMHGNRLVEERMQRINSADDGATAHEIFRRSIHGMLQELQPNLWEDELQRVVDYGHTFSPTIEMHALPELLHGEAVTIDMALSLTLAHLRGLLTHGEYAESLEVIHGLGLPVWHPVCTHGLLRDALADTVRHRNGQQLIPLTDGLGHACFVNDVTSAELEEALKIIVSMAGSPGFQAGRRPTCIA